MYLMQFTVMVCAWKPLLEGTRWRVKPRKLWVSCCPLQDSLGSVGVVGRTGKARAVSTVSKREAVFSIRTGRLPLTVCEPGVWRTDGVLKEIPVEVSTGGWVQPSSQKAAWALSLPSLTGMPQLSSHTCPPATNDAEITGTTDVLGQKIPYCWRLSYALFSMISCILGLYLDARSTSLSTPGRQPKISPAKCPLVSKITPS